MLYSLNELVAFLDFIENRVPQASYLASLLLFDRIVVEQKLKVFLHLLQEYVDVLHFLLHSDLQLIQFVVVSVDGLMVLLQESLILVSQDLLYLVSLDLSQVLEVFFVDDRQTELLDDLFKVFTLGHLFLVGLLFFYLLQLLQVLVVQFLVLLLQLLNEFAVLLNVVQVAHFHLGLYFLLQLLFVLLDFLYEFPENGLEVFPVTQIFLR